MITSRKISVQVVTALLAAFAAAVLLAAMPSPAAALSWSTPATDLSAAARNAQFPQVATGADGTTVVFWTSGNTLQARIRPAGSDTFGAVEDLSSPELQVIEPDVAVGADGAITVVWASRLNVGSPFIIKAITRPAGSNTFGATVNLSSEVGVGSWRPQVAVAADGATTVV